MSSASSPSKPIIIEFASSSRLRADSSDNPQSWATSSPQTISTSQLYTSSTIRREPIILTYRSPLRTESQSLLETDAETTRDDESFVHPAELHHLVSLDDQWAESPENVEFANLPSQKSPRRRLFGWALPTDRMSTPLDKPQRRGSGPLFPFSAHSQRLKAPFLTRKKSGNVDYPDLSEKVTPLPRRNTWSSSTPKPFRISSLPAIILSKRENNLSSSSIFCRKKKTGFQPEPIEPPERRPPPPPLPPHLRDVIEISPARQRLPSLMDSLSLDSSLEYDENDDDSEFVAFGPELLLEDDEDASSITNDSVTDPEEILTPSSSHPYALVGFPYTFPVHEDERNPDDVVVLEHTLEEFVLANPISLNLTLPPPRRRLSCPSSTSSKRLCRSNRSHRRPSVPLRLPRSVSSAESLKNFTASHNGRESTQHCTLPQGGSTVEGLRPPLVVEDLVDDSDADFLDLQESVYSYTISSVSRRASFLSDNREEFLDLDWSSSGEDSSLHIR